jgi:hypothetical protein
MAVVHGLLLEPAEAPSRPGRTARERSVAAAPQPALSSVEVVVLGLSAGCGVSTVARGIAVALAVASRSAHVVTLAAAGHAPRPLPRAGLGGGSLWEIPATLSDPEEVAEYGAMVRRLAGPAAVVWDVPSSEAARAALATVAADAVLAVAAGDGEPALAELVAGMLAERFGRVPVVANRAGDAARWSGRAAVSIPPSRIGAMLASRGRRPGGAFGATLADLAALVEEMARP